MLATLVLGGACFVGIRLINNASFNALEGQQARQGAQRIQIALDADMRLLQHYGATNSIWDDSFTNVRDRDQAGFVASFLPDSMQQTYGIDGVIGVSRSGEPVVGVSPILARTASTRSRTSWSRPPSCARCST